MTWEQVTEPAPTEKQLEFIANLCERAGVMLGIDIPEPTTRAEASELIDELKAELGWS